VFLHSILKGTFEIVGTEQTSEARRKQGIFKYTKLYLFSKSTVFRAHFNVECTELVMFIR
jgi:hypothetical protein